MKKTGKTESAPMSIIRAFRREEESSSWRSLNNGLDKIMGAMIECGLEFGENDVSELDKELKLNAWAGDGEGLYQKAVACRNASYCRSHEKWKGRPPFIKEGKRLCIGSKFDWNSMTVHVTSYGKDFRGHYLGCVVYKNIHYSRGVARRLKISIKDLKADRRAKMPKRDDLARLISRASRIAGRHHWSSVVFKDCLSSGSAWLETESAHSIKAIIRDVGIDLKFSDVENAKGAGDLRDLCGGFVDNVAPKLEEWARRVVKERSLSAITGSSK